MRYTPAHGDLSYYERNEVIMKHSLIAAIILLLLLSSVDAGDGTYTDLSPDQIDLHVMFMYDEACFAGANCAEWETLFKEGSKLLYDASERQIRISTIYFYNNCPDASNKADVKIYDDTNLANAHPGGLGKSGYRIRLSQTHKTVTTSGAGDRGQFGLVHELGHYAFGLSDEYKDKGGNNVADAYCIDQSGTVSCVMDGGTTVANSNERHEFCWSSNHRTGKTKQDQKRQIGTTDYEDTNCWTFMQAFVDHHYGATLTLPTEDPTGSTTEHGDGPIFEYYDCGIRSVICIDRSGSMSAALSLAKQGAKNFINLMEETDRAAITSYSSGASVNYSMNAMTDGNKTAAKSAIDSLGASGLTNIGGGLQVSLNQIIADGDPTSNEIIVLLSDGQHNTGTSPASVLPAIKNRKVTVYTIGLGNVDAALMTQIASETGGTYLYASNASQLNSHFIQVLSNLHNNGLIENIAAEMEALEQISVPVYVDSFTGSLSVDFVLSWLDPAVELGFMLHRPDGSEVVPGSPGVTLTYDAGTAMKIYRIETPEVGTWTATVHNPAAGSVGYSLIVMSQPMDITFKATAGEGSYTYPDPVLVRAVVVTDNKVGGATVTANVTRPSGDFVGLALFDDGARAHGDQSADDGIYSAYFNSYTEDGSYTFDVTVDTDGAYTVDNEEDGGEFTSEPVDRFVRTSSFSVVVAGVPGAILATVSMHPETLNTKSRGKFVTAYVELGIHDVSDINVSTVVLKDGGVVALALSSHSEIGDYDLDSIPDLTIKFKRKDVIDYLESVSKIDIPVEFTVEGQLFSGETFAGSSIVQIITPGPDK